MERVDVAAGVIRDAQGRYLLCRRTGRLAGLWEFPGGKRETGESYQTCLERELREELNLTVRAGDILWEQDEQTADRLIHLAFVAAIALDFEGMRLSVHDRVAFAPQGELADYALCPTDARFVAWLAGASRL